MRRIVMFLAAALFIGTAWIPTANAAPEFFGVKVDLVGMVTPTVLELRLTALNGTFTNKRFINTSDIKKEVLATALTAIALDSICSRGYRASKWRK